MYNERIFGWIMVVSVALVLVSILISGVTKSKQKTEDLKQKFSEAVKTYNEKNASFKTYNKKVIPLNSNITTKCISGKKAIIVNGEIYYAGEVNIWGDIKGVDCE